MVDAGLGRHIAIALRVTLFAAAAICMVAGGALKYLGVLLVVVSLSGRRDRRYPGNVSAQGALRRKMYQNVRASWLIGAIVAASLILLHLARSGRKFWSRQRLCRVVFRTLRYRGNGLHRCA